mgnify:FL=1
MAKYLFLDPAFDRQSIIDRFHLSKERIGNAFAQGSDYASLSTFVTHCRLEYATHRFSQAAGKEIVIHFCFRFCPLRIAIVFFGISHDPLARLWLRSASPLLLLSVHPKSGLTAEEQRRNSGATLS